MGKIRASKENSFISKIRVPKGSKYIISCISRFLDPIQKHALSRSVQLEAVYLEALLYWLRVLEELRTRENASGIN